MILFFSVSGISFCCFFCPSGRTYSKSLYLITKAVNLFLGKIPSNLAEYLSHRFQKNSLDHELQNTIRDNLYLRTVPVTTRKPRDSEINGIDYVFLNADEFEILKLKGSLLESGIFEG